MFDQYIQNFDIEKSQNFMNNNWKIPIISTGIYLLFIFLGPKFMKTRKALNIKYSLFIWNLFLSIFSYIVLILIFPIFYKSWKSIGSDFKGDASRRSNLRKLNIGRFTIFHQNSPGETVLDREGGVC